MTTGTKVFLAVFALLVGLLVLYYGVLMPVEDPAPPVESSDVAAAATPAEPDAAARTPSNFPVAARGATASGGAANPGGAETVRMGGDSSSAGTGGVTPVRPDPLDPADLLAETPRDALRPFLEEQGETAGGKNGALPVMGPPVPEAGRAAGAGLTPSAATTSTTTTARRETPAAPAAVSPNRPAAVLATYTVLDGDTLSGIALDWFGDATAWRRILDVNPGVTPERLRAGQTIKLPPRDTAPVGTAADRGAKPGRYVVRAGDTLISIARHFYGEDRAWKRIHQANRAALPNPDRLEAGMVLTIPPAPR